MTQPVDRDGLRQAVGRFESFAARDERLVVEEKPASVALHFRQAPELQGDCDRLVRDILRRQPNLELVRGKMVVELKAGFGNKAQAIERLMALEPFRGRLPLFAGDDVTDEDAFRYVEKFGGVTIKIGPGETAARYRLDDVTGFLAWLAELSGRPGLSEAPLTASGAVGS